jgi:hypothetical protein
MKAAQAFTYQGQAFEAGAEIPPLAIEADDLAILVAKGVVVSTAPKPPAAKPASPARAGARSK